MNVYVNNDIDFIVDNVLLADDSSPIIDMALTLSIGDTSVSGVITGATNATPIVVASTAHGRTTGDQVVIIDVEGNDAANGPWTITVIDANHFSLNSSVGNGAYLAGGVWYLGVAGAVGLSMPYSASPPRYKVTTPGTLALDITKTYLRLIQASNYGFRIEETFQPLKRRG